MEDKTILIKGAGEKASAIAHRLYWAGFRKIVMTDLTVPMAERRGVSFSEALIDWRKEILGVVAERTDPSMDRITKRWAERKIPVIADPESMILKQMKPDIFIDGVMAKRNMGTTLQNAPLVVALGPGFVAGKDCHFVVETNPSSPFLGQVISEGEADENTGTPTSVMGLTTERLLKAPVAGKLVSLKEIGEDVAEGETVAYVDWNGVKAKVSGCIWGLLHNGIQVKKGQKIGDVDPRGRRKLCFEITAEARTIADGVLKGIQNLCRPR
jgi:xanthine dehydrogenase accessory factor